MDLILAPLIWLYKPRVSQYKNSCSYEVNVVQGSPEFIDNSSSLFKQCLKYRIQDSLNDSTRP